MDKLLVVLIVLALAALVPFLAIWAVNTLFLTAIPVNGATWFAALVLMLMIGGRR